MKFKMSSSIFKVLQCMIKIDGFLSKPTICKRTNVATEDIDKVFGELGNRGYKFTFNPHLGYKLMGYPKDYSAILVKAGLETKIVGTEIEVHKEVLSTNRELLNRSYSKEGTVVLAETQSHGRGRGDNKWISPEGGIYLSILLKPRKKLERITIFNLIGAISVAETLEELYSIPISIKWPNDVMLEGKKICGILSEMKSSSENIIVMGIGVNVNSDSQKLPSKSISIKEYLKGTEGLNKVEIIWRLLENIEEKYSLYKSKKFKEIVERWKFYSGLLGEQVKISSASGKVLSGYVNDIDANSGAIILRTDRGIEKIILEGRVEKI